MTGKPIKIHPLDYIRPFVLYAPRSIPLAWHADTKKLLENMVQQGIIQPAGDETYDWCQPMVIVPRHKGGIRITVDFTKLNKRAFTSCPSGSNTM